MHVAAPWNEAGVFDVADDLDLVRPESLADSLAAYLEVLSILEEEWPAARATWIFVPTPSVEATSTGSA